MTLAEVSLHVLVGLRRPAPVTATVMLHGRDVPGVAPVPIGKWSAAGPAVAATVAFGPFATAVSFDMIRLWHGTDLLADLPRLSVMNLDPGDIFQEDVFLDGTDG